jgi:hypothetical protein
MIYLANISYKKSLAKKLSYSSALFASFNLAI